MRDRRISCASSSLIAAAACSGDGITDSRTITPDAPRYSVSGAPPLVVNVTGGDTLPVRELASGLGRRLGVEPRFEGRESTDALLSDTARLRSLLAAPEMPVETMLDWIADWVGAGRPLLGKPTHFETRDGAF